MSEYTEQECAEFSCHVCGDEACIHAEDPFVAEGIIDPVDDWVDELFWCEACWDSRSGDV